MRIARAPQGLVLRSVSLDRAAADRDQPGIVGASLHAADTRVLVLRGALAPLAADGVSLAWTTAAHVGNADPVALLGRGESGEALLLAHADQSADEVRDDVFQPPGGWAELRAVGGSLMARDAEILIQALSLSRWLREAPFCAACGTLTELGAAGWMRSCPACGRDHFPRTDPAVIVAVTDGERLLLGSNAAWPSGLYSCFAGFVEAGESAEGALVREIEEESGVVVDHVEYVGSQAWPYPRSLMLGYLAHTSVPSAARPDGTEIIDVRWFTAAQIAAALAGEGDITLPGSASISRALIEQWHERASSP